MTDRPSDGPTASEESRRGHAYKLLSECYHPPDEKLVALLEAAGRTDERARRLAAAASADVRALRVDHAKLFVGPYELLASPYGSVYLDDADRVMTESTYDAVRLYRSEGLDVALDEPADHVAAELEFMYYLVGKEVEALAESEHATVERCLGKQRTFLDRHLGQWIATFADAVEEHAETEFYRTVARETRVFVERDRRRVTDLAGRLADDATEPGGERIADGT